MADLRITGAPLAPIPRPSETARARAAFFQAALNGVASAEPARPVQTQPTAPGRASAPTAAPEPSRYARPGSLLDIKV